MAKSSSPIFFFIYFHHFASKPSAPGNPTTSGIPKFTTKNPKIIQNPTFSTWSSNSRRSYISSAPNVTKFYGNLDPDVRLLLHRSYLGFSSKNYEMGSKKFTEKMRNPGATVMKAFTRYREAGAKYGFLALSSAIVAFTGLYVRARFTVNPDTVYRMAMRRLNTSAGILEVMGTPCTGTDLRAFVTSGGGMTLKNFQTSIRSKRCFLIFPIHGSERKGLVRVEVKKKKEEYRIGGGLISELRDAVVRAMAATKEFEDRDEMEDEEDAARELQEEEKKRREKIEKLEKNETH